MTEAEEQADLKLAIKVLKKMIADYQDVLNDLEGRLGALTGESRDTEGRLLKLPAPVPGDRLRSRST